MGINNRNLKTLDVSLETSLELRALIPEGVTVVAESGIKGPADVRLLRAGRAGRLFGGHQPHAGPEPVRRPAGAGGGHMTPRVKICGITRVADALAACALGADALGFVLAPSPRQVSPDQARVIIAVLPPLVSTVGVFVDAPPKEVARVRAFCGLDWVQLHGAESEGQAASLGPRVIKALKVGPGREPDAGAYPDCAPAFGHLSPPKRPGARAGALTGPWPRALPGGGP